MTGCDVAIIGAGVMGAAAACELAAAGVRVTLIDQAAIPNPRAASFDHSKVFRFAYPDTFYVRLAVDALALWRAMEMETGERLLTTTGLALLGHRRPSLETRSYDALRSLGLEAEMLDPVSAAARFPQFDAGAFSYAVVDPSGAIIHADTAVHALIGLARRRGVSVVEGERVTAFGQSAGGRDVVVTTESGNSYRCAGAVVASGPWTRKLLPEIGDKLTTTRQEVVYFEPVAGPSPLSFDIGRFPIFAEFESGFYGFPIHHGRSMKIANHTKGEQVDPYLVDEAASDAFIEECRDFFASFIPGLASARVAETRVCIYNNTPDDDFIIDWHPERENVLIVTGFSGHGFKFAPVVGRIAGELMQRRQPSHDIVRFGLSRLADG